MKNRTPSEHKNSACDGVPYHRILAFDICQPPQYCFGLFTQTLVIVLNTFRYRLQFDRDCSMSLTAAELSFSQVRPIDATILTHAIKEISASPPTHLLTQFSKANHLLFLPSRLLLSVPELHPLGLSVRGLYRRQVPSPAMKISHLVCSPYTVYVLSPSAKLKVSTSSTSM